MPSSRARLTRLLPALFFVLLAGICLAGEAKDAAHQIVAQAILEEDGDKKTALINSLIGKGDASVKSLLELWKQDAIYVYKGDGDLKIPVTLVEGKDADEKQAAVRIDDGQPLRTSDGKDLRIVASDFETAEHDSNLRAVMKGVLDLLALFSPERKQRLQAISTIGMSQDAEKLSALLATQANEKDEGVQKALREAIALIHLKDAHPSTQSAACRELAVLQSIPSQDFLKAVATEAEGNPKKAAVGRAAREALAHIGEHVRVVNTMGTAFRGLSTGSILLVVALGLAITFGLMGVINMAHGEVMAVGAYATYVVQNVFGPGLALAVRLPFNIAGKPPTLSLNLPGMNLSGNALDAYFIVALPVAFLSAALVGIILERGVIRFLYRRPLESLLATWGVSLVMQQLFRLVFGANNVQVYSPAYLSGNWTVDDVLLGWNRVFVIGFAVAIVIGTHLILTRTPLGLLIRAVMQNRQMAACMGVRTERVNMLTFGLGSGLAGLAGAFLSQIGNVGPGLGQNYIVDCFMTVVVGGVGNIIGTVVSALGIGLADQSLQQILLNPVLGKIIVLAGIILFLQWRPAGLFVTKSRSLEG